MGKENQTKIYYFFAFLLVMIRITLSLRLPPYIWAYLKHDDLWMVERAWNIINGNWLGSYDQYTLIKGCFSPLLLAISYKIGIPYLLFNTFLYTFSCIFFVWSLSDIIKSYYSRIIMLLILLFNPISFALQTYQRIYRNGIMQWLLLILFGCVFYIYLHRNNPVKTIPFLIIEGFIIWAIYNVREDTIWIMPFVIVSNLFIIIPYIFNFIKKIEKINYLFNIVIFLFPLLVYGLLSIATMELNKHYYGVALLNDRTRGGYFPLVVKDLYRIDTENDFQDKYLLVTRKAFEQAFAVSPTLRLAKKEINDSLDRWSKWSKNNSEVYWDHCFFALRDGVANGGYYTSLNDSETFYKKVHEELLVAFNNKSLKSKKALIISQAGVLKKDNLSSLFSNSIDILFKNVSSFNNISAGIIPPDGSQQQIDLFQTMTGIDYIRNGTGTIKIVGWAFVRNGEMDIGIKSRNNEIRKLTFIDSFDVYKHFKEKMNENIENAKCCRFSEVLPADFEDFKFVDSSGNIISTDSNFSFHIDLKEHDRLAWGLYGQYVNRCNKIIKYYTKLINPLFLVCIFINCLFFICLTTYIIKKRIISNYLIFVNLSHSALFLSLIVFILIISYVNECSFQAWEYIYLNSAHMLVLLYISTTLGYSFNLIFNRNE